MTVGKRKHTLPHPGVNAPGGACDGSDEYILPHPGVRGNGNGNPAAPLAPQETRLHSV